MIPENVFPVGLLPGRYAPAGTEPWEAADFERYMKRLQAAMMANDAEAIEATLEILKVKCPLTMDGLASEAGRLHTLTPDALAVVVVVLWVLVRSEAIRFAAQRAHSYGLPQGEQEKVVDMTLVKVMAQFEKPLPTVKFRNYDRFAAYMNSATTMNALTIRKRYSKQPRVGSLTGREDMRCRPLTALGWLRGETRKNASPSPEPGPGTDDPNAPPVGSG
jgi:hypothetical protein